MKNAELVIVRGGGDIATGIIQKLHRAGLRVLVLETEQPLAIRRTVSLCEAVYEGAAQVEDVAARLVSDETGIEACFAGGQVPLVVDPLGHWITKGKPQCVVDAILAKRNLGTTLAMAEVVIAVGPGFCAGMDAHGVIETMRGHDLGRLILQGPALPNTGIPGELGGRSAERVLHAPTAGVVRHIRRIGDVVQAGEPVLAVGEEVCTAAFHGLLRGLIRQGVTVAQGTKLADVDPRMDVNPYTISDKARCIGGAVLEAYFYFKNRGESG